MAAIPADTITRYQPGGDIYNALAEQYGLSAADVLAAAAASGDRATLTEALANVKYGAPLNDSTASILADQLLTDPLGAPLDALTSGIDQIFNSEGVKTVLTLAIVAGVVWLVIHDQ